MKPKRTYLAKALLLFISVIFILNSFSMNASATEESIEFSISLWDGLNLISIPVVQEDTDILDVLDSIDGQWDYVQWFNTSSALWESYVVGRPPFLQTLWDINWTMGFWIHTTEACNLTGNGSAATEPIYLIHNSQWNMVGFPRIKTYPYDYTVGDVKSELNVTIVYGQDLEDVSEGNITILDDSYILRHETGYYFNTSENVTWFGPWLYEPPIQTSVRPDIDFAYDQLDKRQTKIRVVFNYTGDFKAIREYRWNYGDGTGTKGTRETEPVHTYAIKGNYTVSLEIIAQDGRIFNTTQLIVLDSDFIEFDLDSGNVMLGDLTYWIPILAISGLIGMGIALADPPWLQKRKYWNSEIQGIFSTLAFLVGILFLLIQMGIINQPF